ncbi:flagellin [Simiduia agarivorans]|uniref:Flagellin n=1 Tax=Simiduia agarivorans (strain DSM 21679 / JCM 13881 / BCRC 17597 / SA1) TaxID=1117647 RepID=K4KI95_SIMAS|nr:flagellin [Simiduia agarivorans]AFU97673.1 flagellin/flagellar hook associated protein [Simiduia agarivorans SA1 = DSM 21679]
MPLVINTNVQSLNAQRQLVKSGADLARAQERLASGLRINKAADDAAGLAISNRLTSQVRGLNQAVRNANDGVSMIQTAEGGLNEITNILQRMRELSIQSANGIYSDADRSTLNAEVQQLKTEVQRIADTTSFNGQALLDGSLGNVALQIGSQAFQTVDVNIAEVNNQKLGVSAKAGLSSFSQTDLTANLNGLGTGDLVLNGVAIDAAKASADTASSVNKTSSAISIAAAINEKSSLTGVVAEVEGTTLQGAAASTGTAVSGALTINGVSIGTLTSTTSTTAAEGRAIAVAAINQKSDLTGVVAIDTGDDNGGVTLYAADGRNISVSATFAAGSMAAFGLSTGATTTNTVTTGTVALRSVNGGDITIDQGATGNTEDAGFSIGTFSGVQAQVSSDLNNNTAMAAGDVKINGVIIGASVASDDTASSGSNASSAIAKAAAINKVADQTGVTAVVRENVAVNNVAQDAASDAVSGTVNGVSITGFTTVANDTSGSRQAFVAAINAISGQTGVTAIDTGENGSLTGGGIRLIAEDGRNIETNFTNADHAGFINGAQTFNGEFTLVSDKEIVIERGTTANIANSGLKVGTYGNAKDGISVANIDISTEAGAQQAIQGLDNAIDAVNATRADLGAINNRLDFAVANLQNASENTAAARSRIQDADFAAETANLSRAQVLQQASTAILAQANAAPQQVLSLLQ